MTIRSLYSLILYYIIHFRTQQTLLTSITPSFGCASAYHIRDRQTGSLPFLSPRNWSHRSSDVAPPYILQALRVHIVTRIFVSSFVYEILHSDVPAKGYFYCRSQNKVLLWDDFDPVSGSLCGVVPPLFNQDADYTDKCIAANVRPQAGSIVALMLPTWRSRCLQAQAPRRVWPGRMLFRLRLRLRLRPLSLSGHAFKRNKKKFPLWIPLWQHSVVLRFHFFRLCVVVLSFVLFATVPLRSMQNAKFHN